MHIEPDTIYEKLTILGEQWADDNAAADLLEETRKTLVSQLGAGSGETSATARESYALRHENYVKHVKEMIDARKAANKSRVRYDSAKVYAELLRTKAANERAAMREAV